jgi:DNA-directed RNA polymerase specialized sigma24 family protein
VAERDPALAHLVLGTKDTPPICPSPYELVEHMRRATGRQCREEAANLIRVLLREASVDPFVSRLLVQALLPGLISVAGKLQWGRGGEWKNGDEFFSELLTTTWVTIDEWTGQDRPYAVLDLLSAIRCRLRRQLLRSKEQHLRQQPLPQGLLTTLTVRPETDLEELTRILIDLRQQGMRADEVQVLYAQHVLGFSISELAVVSGRDRRALYARRDRGRRRLCA